MTSMVIIGAGPGGYEAASVAAAGGVEVTVVEETGIGGAAVLTDCVPSKTLIATAEVTSTLRRAAELGLRHTETFEVDLDAVNFGCVSLPKPSLTTLAADWSAKECG